MNVENYDINLNVDFINKKYTGIENIKIKEPLKILEFDLNEIDIIKTKIDNVDVNFNVENDKLKINYDGNKKEIVVYIEFSTTNDNGLRGFYIAGTKDDYILSTQFEESDARRAFPCIDNPSYKATFDLQLSIDTNLNAISNMPIKHEIIENNKKIVSFEQTPVMSTYLLYIGVGQFDEMPAIFGQKKIFLAAKKGSLNSTEFPLDMAKKSLEYLQNYTNIEYMLPKLHLIAVPEFAAGAMENWGAITFREILLNINDSSTSRSYRRVAEVITHELVHQWFGDLVTMKWWNDLWLNESFATFFAFKTVNETMPEWDFYGEFLLDQTDGAYTMDSLVNSHPINVNVGDLNVSQLSYEIRYGKGSNILRMIEAYVGNNKFMESLRNYLKKFSYSNAAGADLWNSIEDESRKNIPEIMGQWVSSTGYPYIEAKREENKLKLTQHRFLFLKNDDMIWKIPVFVNKFSQEETILMQDKSIALEGDILSLNYNHFGFYRVLYDRYLFENISRNLDKITSYEKWGIVNDLYAFMLSGKIDLTEYIRRIEIFYRLNDTMIIEEISKQLFNMYNLTGKQYYKDIASFYIKDKIEYIENNKINDANYKIVLSALYTRISYIDNDFRKKIVSKYSSYSTLDPDFRQSYLIAKVLGGNDLEYITKIITESKNDEDKTKAIVALGSITGEDNYRKIMNLIESGNVKKQDADTVFVSMANNMNSRKYIVDNIENIVNTMFKLKLSNLRINRCVQNMIGNAGIVAPEKMRAKARELTSNQIEGGVKKGLEFLDVYENLLNKA